MQTQSKDKKEWKKKTIPLITFRKDDPKGVETIEGIFLKRRDAGVSIEEDGSERPRFTLIFQNLTNEEKFQVWENAGLRNALEMNDVHEGEAIRLVHLGKVPRSSGKGEVNQYDVFTLN